MKEKITGIIKISPRYCETDQMGVIHHAVFFTWFEEGRLKLMRERGLDYAEIETNGFKMPVIACSARYHRPARFGQSLELKTEIAELSSKILAFKYELLNPKTKEKIATGSSRHVLLDRNNKVKNFPSEWIDKLS